FGRAPNPPDKVHPLVGSRIGDPEQRAKNKLLQQADVERPDRVLMVDPLGIDRQALPPSVEKKAESPHSGRDRIANRLQPPECSESLAKRGRGQAVQVFHQTIIRQNPELVAGEEDRQEPVVLLVARVARVRGPTLPPGPPRAG